MGLATQHSQQQCFTASDTIQNAHFINICACSIKSCIDFLINGEVLNFQENANLIDDQNQWEQELSREVEEARDDFNDNLENLTKEYEEDLKNWKLIHGNMLFIPECAPLN